MKQLRLSNEEEYSRRFRAHLFTWEDVINSNPSLQPQVSSFNKGKHILIPAILFWAFKIIVEYRKALAGFILLIILGLLLLVILIIALAVWDNARAKTVALIKRNNLLISPYLYGYFLDIEPRGDIDARCDIELFCAGMRLAVPSCWVAAEINGTGIYFLPNGGLILCKDNPDFNPSPIVFSSSPIQNPKIAAARLQLGEFSYLARTGHLYSSDPAAARRLLQQKEPLIGAILKQSGAEVCLLYSQKQQFFYLADYPTDLAFFDINAELSNPDLTAFFVGLYRSLMHFEQLTDNE